MTICNKRAYAVYTENDNIKINAISYTIRSVGIDNKNNNNNKKSIKNYGGFFYNYKYINGEMIVKRNKVNSDMHCKCWMQVIWMFIINYIAGERDRGEKNVFYLLKVETHFS